MRRTVIACAVAIATVGPPVAASADSGALDVQHYRIAVHINPQSGQLRGRTTVTARAPSSVRLDLALQVDRVSVNGTPVAFRQDGLALVLRNPAPDSTVRIVVDYHGTPSLTWVNGENPWMASDDEQVASGEPRIAPWWFPANDRPGDKATYDVIGFVPRGQQFISNGHLIRQEGRRWHWRTAEPMATYVTVLAAGRYRGSEDWRYAVAKDQPRANMSLLRQTPTLVDWLSTQLGPYPFAQAGGIVSGTFRNEDWSMETQTRPTYPDLTRLDDTPELMVHELAHQWFGDSVTPRRWRDIWLNEGFARWMELRYLETHGGQPAATWLQKNDPRHGAWFWNVRIGSPRRANLLSAPVYDRGAMAVQALRQRLGDETFFRLLQVWTTTYWHGTATVEDFRRVAAQVSGQDLDGFFEAWLFDRGRPAPTAENGLAPG